MFCIRARLYRLRKNPALCHRLTSGWEPPASAGGSTLQRRGKSRTSINRALALVRTRRAIQSADVLISSHRSHVLYQGMTLQAAEKPCFVSRTNFTQGGSSLLQQGGATLQRRGKSRTSINRALALVRTRRAIQSADVLISSHRSHVLYQGMTLQVAEKPCFVSRTNFTQGGSPLLQQGGATLQRRGKSCTSINRALALVRTRRAIQSADVLISGHRSHVLYQGMTLVGP
jgi:hypothetical protein